MMRRLPNFALPAAAQTRASTASTLSTVSTAAADHEHEHDSE